MFASLGSNKFAGLAVPDGFERLPDCSPFATETEKPIGWFLEHRAH